MQVITNESITPDLPSARFEETLVAKENESQPSQANCSALCVSVTVLYTTVDAQCDKVATVVGRTKLSALAAIYVT